jgi:hypothetical protein
MTVANRVASSFEGCAGAMSDCGATAAGSTVRGSHEAGTSRALSAICAWLAKWTETAGAASVIDDMLPSAGTRCEAFSSLSESGAEGSGARDGAGM